MSEYRPNSDNINRPSGSSEPWFQTVFDDSYWQPIAPGTKIEYTSAMNRAANRHYSKIWPVLNRLEQTVDQPQQVLSVSALPPDRLLRIVREQRSARYHLTKPTKAVDTNSGETAVLAPHEGNNEEVRVSVTSRVMPVDALWQPYGLAKDSEGDVYLQNTPPKSSHVSATRLSTDGSVQQYTKRPQWFGTVAFKGDVIGVPLQVQPGNAHDQAKRIRPINRIPEVEDSILPPELTIGLSTANEYGGVERITSIDVYSSFDRRLPLERKVSFLDKMRLIIASQRPNPSPAYRISDLEA